MKENGMGPDKNLNFGSGKILDKDGSKYWVYRVIHKHFEILTRQTWLVCLPFIEPFSSCL